MTDISVPYSDVGNASFEQLDTWLQSFLLAGNQPELASFPFTMEADQTLELGQVVGLNGSGRIVPAVYDATYASAGVRPIGVMTQAVTTAPAVITTQAPVWYSGCFSLRGLTWDASFTTDAEKTTAFRGAPTPTTITVRKRQSDV